MFESRLIPHYFQMIHNLNDLIPEFQFCSLISKISKISSKVRLDDSNVFQMILNSLVDALLLLLLYLY